MAGQYRVPNLDDINLSEVLNALGDPVRLKLVRLLLDVGESTCTPMCGLVGITPSTLSHHLRILRDAGLTRVRPAGTQRWTSLRTEELQERFPGLLAWLEAALRHETRHTDAEAEGTDAGTQATATR